MSELICLELSILSQVLSTSSTRCGGGVGGQHLNTDALNVRLGVVLMMVEVSAMTSALAGAASKSNFKSGIVIAPATHPAGTATEKSSGAAYDA